MTAQYVYAASLPGSSSYSPKVRKLSSGRGDSGNLVRPSSILLGLELEAEAVKVLQRRREGVLYNTEQEIIYTGRGGKGNIASATMQQTIPYDVSLDPDDSYEEIVREKAVKVRMNMRTTTGRGGSGNTIAKNSPNFDFYQEMSKSQERSGRNSDVASVPLRPWLEHRRNHSAPDLALANRSLLSLPSGSSSPVRPYLQTNGTGSFQSIATPVGSYFSPDDEQAAGPDFRETEMPKRSRWRKFVPKFLKPEKPEAPAPILQRVRNISRPDILNPQSPPHSSAGLK